MQGLDCYCLTVCSGCLQGKEEYLFPLLSCWGSFNLALKCWRLVTVTISDGKLCIPLSSRNAWDLIVSFAHPLIANLFDKRFRIRRISKIFLPSLVVLAVVMFQWQFSFHLMNSLLCCNHLYTGSGYTFLLGRCYNCWIRYFAFHLYHSGNWFGDFVWFYLATNLAGKNNKYL